MKKHRLIIAFLMCLPFLSWAVKQETVYIPIKGMTCQFCVYGVKKKLSSLPNVQRAQVSLRKRRGRIIYKPGAKPNLKLIMAAIKDAGYTAGKHKIVVKEAK